jgi:hypothetical protein
MATCQVSFNHDLNLMAGRWCSIMYWFSHKTRVDIKNGRVKAIKAALSLISRCLIHNVMFEVGFHFRSLTTTFSCLALDHTLSWSFDAIANDVGANTFPFSLQETPPALK